MSEKQKNYTSERVKISYLVPNTPKITMELGAAATHESTTAQINAIPEQQAIPLTRRDVMQIQPSPTPQSVDNNVRLSEIGRRLTRQEQASTEAPESKKVPESNEPKTRLYELVEAAISTQASTEHKPITRKEKRRLDKVERRKRKAFKEGAKQARLEFIYGKDVATPKQEQRLESGEYSDSEKGRERRNAIRYEASREKQEMLHEANKKSRAEKEKVVDKFSRLKKRIELMIKGL